MLITNQNQREEVQPYHSLLRWLNDLKKEIQEPQEAFTRRELEIIALIAKGDSSYEIAHKLFISKQTVDTHRKNIYRKGKFRCVRDVVVYQLLLDFHENTQKMVLSQDEYNFKFVEQEVKNL